MISWFIRIQKFVLISAGFFPFRAIYRGFYIVGAFAFYYSARILFPAIQRIDLRRGAANSPLIPGSSDVDLGILFHAKDTEEEIRFLREFWIFYRKFKCTLPFLGEVQLLNVKEAKHVQWRPTDPPPSEEPYRRRWECAHEALSACFFLLEQTYFDADPASHPEYGYKVAKGCLDVLRYSEAVRSEGAPLSRKEYLRQMEDSRLKSGFKHPLTIDKDFALETCCRALRILDSACARFIDAVKAQKHPAEIQSSIETWDYRLPNSESFAWRSRLKTLEEGRFPTVSGFYSDSLFRWLVIAHVEEPLGLSRLFEQLDSWHRGDPHFKAPPLLLSRNMFQVLAWTCYLDSPFFYFSLSPDLNPLGLRVRRRGNLPLLSSRRNEYRVQWKVSTTDFDPPPTVFLRYGARHAVANLTRALRLFGQDHWAGDNTYRVCLLYGRLLSLHLYLEHGVVTDPDDLESLLPVFERYDSALFAKVEPSLFETLKTPADDWNSLDSSHCFYRHYPNFTLLIGGLLRHVP